MGKNNRIPEALCILSDESNIFSSVEKGYVIPLYQRAFAWGENEIVQLIEDINDISEEVSNYYLGSLIVHHRDDGFFEVIDGQQRLTTLYILLNSIEGIDVRHSLRFDCREKSNITLEHIKDLDDLENVEEQILSGKKTIERTMADYHIDCEEFKEKLKKVRLYRIEVPTHTDLNRYFEIMNTRGEQLEQQDIVKADLMSRITDHRDRLVFAEIWDACSDMTGYVQMHFSVDARDNLFGWDWTNLPSLESVLSLRDGKLSEMATGITIKEMIRNRSSEQYFAEETEDDERVRFESIIDFRFFLLHALRVYVQTEGIKNGNDEGNLVSELLDDKKLREAFERVLDYGIIEGSPLFGNDFAMGFIICLLRLRVLFDRYIIKREFSKDDSDGVWSLKELRVSGSGARRKPYYASTKFNVYREWETTYIPRNRRNLMIQGCLRVSYTSPKVMHWITRLLTWLYQNDSENLECLNEFSIQAESIAKEAVVEQFLSNGEYNMGVDTPHIVFNYLDYLLWKQDEYQDFEFEFRNSVEHWYPQNPSDGSFPRWNHDDGLDYFGNLCIIQRSVNSRFSNMAPEAKKSSFRDSIAKGSLKLRIMSDLTTDSNSWKTWTCKEHGEVMIYILKADCGLI